MIDSKDELVRGYKFPMTNCSMLVRVGSDEVGVEPLDQNGFCIRFDSPVSLEVGSDVTYSIVDNETGEVAEGLEIKIISVDTLKINLHRIGAIYNN